MPILDSACGLMKIRDVLLMIFVHAGFAPEVCKLAVLLPDGAGLASSIEFGSFLLEAS